MGGGEEPIPLSFRVRWTAIDQDPSGKRDVREVYGESTGVPYLGIQYVPDDVYYANHVASISPLDEGLELADDEILALERVASQHETEVILLG